MAVLNLKKINLGQIFLVTGLLFIIDRLTKYLALFLPNKGIFYWPKVGLKLHLNQGFAFSLPLKQTLIIFLSTLIIFILISFWLKYYQTSHYHWLWPITLIIIGAVSNLFDRIKFGAVIDFLDISFWPAFNLADCYIAIGVIWLVILAKRLKMD